MRSLPMTLSDALDALEKDSVLAEVLGKELVAGFLKKKRAQWNEYCKVVTEWEIEVADDY